jgi:FKBP-type peptidyl-prolyl cis-trans isomerase FkpA
MRLRHLAVSLLLITSATAAIACRGGGSSSPAPTATEPPLTPPALQTLAAPPTVTSDQLQITDITVGTGDEAQAGDFVYVNFNEWLADGTWIDTSFGSDPTPVPDRLTLRTGQVIAGLMKGIPGMKVGGKRRLVIPPELGFGPAGSGNTVPPSATLIYDIELVRVSHP